MENVQIVRKLSMRVLAGGKPTPPENLGETKWIANVIGLANSIKTGESNFGPWRALIGSFIAEAPSVDKPGEIARFRTGQLFLPDVALDLVAPAVLASKKSEQVQFAFRIGVVKDDASATGYVYVAEALIEPEENDPLSLLAGKALPRLSLPAPEPGDGNENGNGDGEVVDETTGEVVEPEAVAEAVAEKPKASAKASAKA